MEKDEEVKSLRWHDGINIPVQSRQYDIVRVVIGPRGCVRGKGSFKMDAVRYDYVQ